MKKVWTTPPKQSEYRLAELFNRYRQIVLELKGLTLQELADIPHQQELEDQILNDFVKLEQKYLTDEPEHVTS
ncbi:hypothetical protein [Fodinibius sp.]|uniref:hypothetical protein n=1 Tax=Fodinibius sp. TaxID=1872440 RepID=UPI002ACE5B06|nr:hypothetical protein [Fodinibius sp.]MDZ7658039.1 hypothetical protein [Fodinibius sp.]